MPTQADYLNLSQAAYTTGGATPVAPPGWTLLTSQTTSNGMQAAAFQNTTTHEIVISYEGTNLDNLTSNFSFLYGQMSADAAIANGVNPQANIDAMNFARTVADLAGGNPIYITGHSLGGEEAEYVQANGGANGLTISGGAAFAGPGVPQLSVGTGNDPNFTTYLDYGDGIGNFVPSGGSHVGNVQYIGNPQDATLEQNLIATDTTGAGSSGALAMMAGDHLLAHYASDLGVTLSQAQNQSSLGPPDIVDWINTFGVVPYGGVGTAPSSSPQDQNGSLIIGGDTLAAANGLTSLQIGNNDPSQILTGTNETATAGTAGVDVLVDAGTDNTISAGSAAQAILISVGTGATLQGGSGQNLLYAMSNGATIDSGSGTNQILVDGTGETANASSSMVTLDNGTQVTLTGNGNTITGDAAGTLTLSGSDNTATLAGGANGTMATVTDNGTGDHISAGDGTNLTINGSGNVDTNGASSNTWLEGSDNRATVGAGGMDIGGTNDIGTAGSGAVVWVDNQGNTLDAGGGATGITAYDRGSYETVNLGDQSTLIDSGSYNVENTGSDTTAMVTGNDNTLDGGIGDTLTLSGTGELVNGAGFSVSLDAGAAANVSGGVDSGDMIDVGSGAYLGLLGGSGYTVTDAGNLISTSANTGLALLGGNDTVDLGAGDTLGLQSGASYTVNATSGTVALNAGGMSAAVNGSGTTVSVYDDGDAVAASNDTVQIGSGITAAVNGSSNLVNVGTGDLAYVTGGSNDIYLDTSGGTLSLSGTSNNVTAAGDTIEAASAASLNLSGGNDEVSMGGSADYLGLLGGSGYTVNESGGTVATWANTSFNLAGGGDVADLGTGDYLGLLGGSGYTVNESGGTVATWANTSFNLAGGGDVADLGSGDYLGLLGGSGYSVNGSNDTLATDANTSFNLAGGGDVADLGSGSYLGLLGGSGYSVNGSGDTIDTLAGTGLNLADGNDQVSMSGSGDYLGLLGSSGYSVVETGGTLATTASTSAHVSGSNDTISLGSGNDAVIYGSNDVIYGSSDSFHIVGNDDVIYGSSDNGYASGTGDAFDGSGDAGSGSGFGGGGGGGGYGYYGLVAGTIRKGPGIDVVAQYDLSHGHAKAAHAAEMGRQEAIQVFNDAVAGRQSATPFEPAKWNGGAITWNFANDSGTAASPFTGTMSAQDQAVIEQAMQTWESAAGITFDKVGDSAMSDIRIGWNRFGTAASGVLGYTSFQAHSGTMAPGLMVQLEDPTEDPLAAGSNGTPEYSGTGVTLYQLALHEIGHALGLADNADPNSVMYAELGPANTTLDAADIANIDALYGPGQRITQAIAGFGAVSAAAPIVSPGMVPPPHPTLTASPLH